jgi:hypothetical protein
MGLKGSQTVSAASALRGNFLSQKNFLWHQRAQLLAPASERKQPSAIGGFHEGPMIVRLNKAS